MSDWTYIFLISERLRALILGQYRYTAGDEIAVRVGITSIGNNVITHY